jgi:hypothetical protein
MGALVVLNTAEGGGIPLRVNVSPWWGEVMGGSEAAVSSTAVMAAGAAADDCDSDRRCKSSTR